MSKSGKNGSVIIYTSRIRKLHDANVVRLLENKTNDLPRLKRLILVNKHGQVIDISKKV